MKKVKNLPLSLDEIAVSQIIFDHSEWVSLWGYMISDNHQSRMDFILTFDTLNKLLRLSGPTGDQIQMLLVDRLEQGIKEPTIIDQEELYGKPLHFNMCRIEVSKTGISDEEGIWHEDPDCLSIDAVYPLLERRNPAIAPGSSYQQQFSTCMDMLRNAYELYLGYGELGYDEETSLQKAALQDDLKFKMAYYAWQMKRSA
jgi:hypothetical protein